MSRSLRARLLFGVVPAAMLVLAGSCLMVHVLMRASLLAEFDAALAGKARALAALVEQDEGPRSEKVSLDDLPQTVRAAILERARGRTIREIEREHKGGRIIYEVEVAAAGEEAEFKVDAGEAPPGPSGRARVKLEFDERNLPEFQRAERPEYLQLWLANGDVLYRSQALKGRDLSREAGTLASPLCRSADLPDGRRGRVAGVTFVPRRERKGRGTPAQVSLALARDTLDMDRTLARLGLLLLAVCAAATVVSALVLVWIVRAGLRPVAAVARQIEAVGETGLSARVGAEDVPRELAPVVARLNDLLARLEAAFARERAFSADVAHELRTPLAGLRTTLEVALAGNRGLASFEDALRDSLAISCQLHAMVENLLAMARCETGQMEVAPEPVQVGELLRECWRPLEDAAAERELRVEWQVEQPCLLETDREKLRLILRNILGNAVTYADPRGRVRLQCRPADGGVSLTVSNSGSKLGPDEAGHVFERFWRGDVARSDTGVHCGLGLALCERLTALLGGTIDVRSQAGGEFSVTLILPGSPGA